MTEQEWLVCKDPEAMLAAHRPRLSDRKARLFACACCRHFQGGLDLDPRLEEAVRVAHAYAEGTASLSNLRLARRAVATASVDNEVGLLNVAVADDDAFAGALWAVQIITTTYAEMCVPCESLESARSWMSADIVRFLREICDGWWLSSLDRERLWAWKENTIPKLAEAIITKGDWKGLSILADALEDAGFTDADILNHLRGPGPHVRGCWCVDLLLDKK